MWRPLCLRRCFCAVAREHVMLLDAPSAPSGQIPPASAATPAGEAGTFSAGGGIRTLEPVGAQAFKARVYAAPPLRREAEDSSRTLSTSDVRDRAVRGGRGAPYMG